MKKLFLVLVCLFFTSTAYAGKQVIKNFDQVDEVKVILWFNVPTDPKVSGELANQYHPVVIRIVGWVCEGGNRSYYKEKKYVVDRLPFQQTPMPMDKIYALIPTLSDDIKANLASWMNEATADDISKEVVGG